MNNDEDEELEKLRKKRLSELELQQQLATEQSEAQEERLREIEEQKKQILRQILTIDARERLGRLRMAKPDFVNNVEQQLIMIAQSGQLQGPINDEMLLQILHKLTPKRKDISIKRINK